MLAPQARLRASHFVPLCSVRQPMQQRPLATYTGTRCIVHLAPPTWRGSHRVLLLSGAGTRETAADARAAAKEDGEIPDHVLAQLTGGADPTVAGASKGKSLSRGQRKRLLKKQRFLRQMAGGGGASTFMSPAEAKRRAAAQQGLGGVQSLKDVLDTVDTTGACMLACGRAPRAGRRPGVMWDSQQSRECAV